MVFGDGCKSQGGEWQDVPQDGIPWKYHAERPGLEYEKDGRVGVEHCAERRVCAIGGGAGALDTRRGVLGKTETELVSNQPPLKVLERRLWEGGESARCLGETSIRGKPG